MGDKIRVLSVCTSDSLGGAARAAYRIHSSVRALGIDSKMLVKEKGLMDETIVPLSRFVPKNKLYQALDWVRTKVKNKWQHYQWGKYPGKSPFYMSDLRSTDICGALKKIDFDILHLHWVNQRFLPLETLPKDKPIVWTLHDSWAFCGVCHYFLDCVGYQKECGCCPHLASVNPNDLSHRIWRRKQKLYQGLDLHVVTPSRWLGDCAKKSSLLGRFPVTVIPNCLDINVFHPLRETEISPRWQSLIENRVEKPIVLYGAVNATTDKIKGFSYLVSALQILEREGKGNLFELVVFGTDKPQEEIPVSIPIHYVGYVRDEQELASLYNLASVMVVPSLTEVFGQTASEALACGTPVVAFRCSGIQDVVDHMINGYLAKPYVSEDLAKGIIWCLMNNTNGELSERACSKVFCSFSNRVVSNQYYDLYRHLSSDRESESV